MTQQTENGFDVRSFRRWRKKHPFPTPELAARAELVERDLELLPQLGPHNAGNARDHFDESGCVCFRDGGRAMSQRDSGYERKERDLYETPEWVTAALIPHMPLRFVASPGTAGTIILEPAAGSGKMVSALCDAGFQVMSSDIADGVDFLTTDNATEADAIVTNPPYELATEFVQHALKLMSYDGAVAMLLRTDFDHAKTRQHLFSGCRAFAKKVVLTKRIKWFEDSKGQPSFNHAWFIWDWKHSGPPTLAYGP